MKIVVINGAGTSGKDTFVEIIQRMNYNNKNVKVFNTSIIDYVKDVAKTIGWNGEKDERGRKFLCDLKDILTEYDNIPIIKIGTKINMIREACEHDNSESIVFVHMRDAHDTNIIVDIYKEVTTLLIKRENIEQFDNDADKNVDNYDYDVIINNDSSMECLKEKAEMFFNNLMED